MIYATTNLTFFHMRYGALLKAGYEPKWYAKFFGKTEVFYVILNLPKNENN